MIWWKINSEQQTSAQQEHSHETLRAESGPCHDHRRSRQFEIFLGSVRLSARVWLSLGKRIHRHALAVHRKVKTVQLQPTQFDDSQGRVAENRFRQQGLLEKVDSVRFRHRTLSNRSGRRNRSCGYPISPHESGPKQLPGNVPHRP